MPTRQEVAALADAHWKGDETRFRAVLLAIAANMESTSPRGASELRRIADRPALPKQLTVLPTGMDNVLDLAHPSTKIDDMVLDAQTRARLDRILLEQNERARLAEHGLRPMRKLLFIGPPGVGKTMMASVIASHLGIPLMRVQLHSVISSHLGETAAKLGKIFETIRRMRGVYMFDEFDALGARRDARARGEDDVGEMRRVVNSLLQFVENDDSDALIVAATNHPEMIDSAMFRRFDEVLELPMPTPEVGESLIRSRLMWADGIEWDRVRVACDGIGHADLVNACVLVNKNALIERRERIETNELIAALEAKHLSFTPKGSI